MTVSIPTSLSHAGDQRERVLADLAGRGAQLDLGLDAVLLADAVAVGVDPAAVLEDLLGLLRVVRGRLLVHVEPGARGDERVGDLRLAAEQPGVDLVLVDRVGEGLAHRRVGHRAAVAAVEDRAVLGAAADALLGVDRVDVGPVGAEVLVGQRRDRAHLVTQVLDLGDVGVLEVGGEVDLAAPVAGDHRVGVAVPLEHERVEVRRQAGLPALVVRVACEAQLGRRGDGLELERAAGRQLRDLVGPEAARR